MDSSSTAVAHRDGRLHQRPGGTPMQARAPNSFVPTTAGPLAMAMAATSKCYANLEKRELLSACKLHRFHL